MDVNGNFLVGAPPVENVDAIAPQNSEDVTNPSEPSAVVANNVGIALESSEPSAVVAVAASEASAVVAPVAGDELTLESVMLEIPRTGRTYNWINSRAAELWGSKHKVV